MSFERIENLIKNYKKVFGYTPNVEVVVYGKIDLMVTKHCPINKHVGAKNIGCGECSNDYCLIDRKGYKLDLLNDGLCNIRILNPKKLHLINYVSDLIESGVSRVRLEFTNETKRETMDVIEGYNVGELELGGVTNGYFE